MSQASPAELLASRKDVESSSTVRKTPTDPEFLQHHLSTCPNNAWITYSCLPSQQQELIRSVVNTTGQEKTIYKPFSDFLTYLSGRIHSSLSARRNESVPVIEFIPNGTKRMVGHPDKFDPIAAYGPECVGVEGPRTNLEVRTRPNGQIEYTAIPYHRANTLIKIKPDSKNGALQSISYAWRHLEACPDRPGVYCLAVNCRYYQIAWVDSAGPVTSPRYAWKNGEHYQLDPLLCYLYSLYVPPASHTMRDPTITVHRLDTHLPLTWDIHSGGKIYEDCKLISFQPPWGRRTTVFLHIKDGQRTIIKDYYRNKKGRYNEEDFLARIHSDVLMPGVVRLVSSEEVKAYGEVITTAPRPELEDSNDRVACRTKMRLIFSSVGQKLDKVSSLKELLMVFFDLNEIHRALLHVGVLHRDISANNILIRPKHRSFKGDVQLSSNPKLMSDILWTETTNTTADRSTCLLIDFDNSANLFSSTENATENVKVLAQRTGTPMYIARSISSGVVLPKRWHRRYFPMPELSGKAKELYDKTWGAATYEEYCDRNGTCHGSTVPDNNTLRALYAKLSTKPVCHRPHHDVESMFWTLFVTALKAVPKSDLEDVQSGAFLRIWGAFEKHDIGPIGPTEVDGRDIVLRDLIEEGPDTLDHILHPAFLATPLPDLLANLAQHISPEYDFLQGMSKADHLHEAWRRLLLECLVQIDGSPGLDVELDPNARRGRKLKRGRLNYSSDGDNSDVDDEGDSRGKPRARTADSSAVHSLGRLNPPEYVHSCRTVP
ncbi:hypothetical protein NM688_g7005 [Phlebia brevispora]|uniref:Uncharacterized protein n=1 Tax=Phlebia brevispora TaxID=194682 RepID=A0ACC1S9Z4_9APHY|nr:hypothetical protein NM688_g7005 [Phlebia brevispora]